MHSAEVKIVLFISPNLFYVSLAGQLRRIREMISDMTTFYQDFAIALPSIAENVECAAYSEKDCKWYRAKVTKVEENDEVTVFYKDIAREETVKKENLRSLAPKYEKITEGTVACHMVNIEERSEWPKLVHQWLMRALDSYASVRVNKMRKDKNKRSCAVEVWGKTVACQGPFEPFTEEWTNLNHVLWRGLKNDYFIQHCIINNVLRIPQNPQENEIVVPFFDVPVNDLNAVTVELIEILKLDEIVVHILHSDNEAVNQMRKVFLAMNMELQKNGIEQPKLASPSLGRMCCTKFVDNVWYRAQIIGLSAVDEKVHILYVDYGNSTWVDPSTLHEMKQSWFQPAIHCIRCHLDDFRGLNEGKYPEINDMVQWIGTKFKAVIEARNDSMLYKIKLFFK